MQGLMHTFWGSTGEFMKAFKGEKVSEKTQQAYQTFIELSDSW
ncbi:MAG: hypothetical protein N4A74_25875 [Carboxylicivirga sp.]|jgi:hypothetical protein|nr:hypothetical protein [Carboxylicivirga sp.]